MKPTARPPIVTIPLPGVDPLDGRAGRTYRQPVPLEGKEETG